MIDYNLKLHKNYLIHETKQELNENTGLFYMHRYQSIADSKSNPTLFVLTYLFILFHESSHKEAVE